MTQTTTGETPRLRSLVADLGWSGRRLAAATGISTPTMARILRGDRDLTLTELQAIAAALNVPASDLLTVTQQGSAA